MNPKVSVIVPCRNEEKYIKLCLEAIISNDYGAENIEIIVIDGLSTDDSVRKIQEVEKEYPLSEIKVISNIRMITPVAFNLGIRESTGTYILIVGSRHVLSKDYISTCFRILSTRSEIACVGSVGELVFDSLKSEMIAYATSSSFGVGISFRTQSDVYVDTVGIPFYRRAIFDEIGYFDEDLVRNQDDELNYRVRNKGYKIYITSETSIKYFVRTHFKDLSKQYYQYGYWKVLVNKKHKTVTTIRQVVPSLFVLYFFIGLITCVLVKHFVLFYLLSLFIYVFTGIVFSLRKTLKPISIIYIIRAYFTLHFSYGTGYLNGILDFLLLNRKPNPNHTSLSR